MATELKDQYDYVIAGAGVAAAAAAGGIRAVDATGTVLIVGVEPDPPVYRPDLSKKLWLEEGASADDSALELPDSVTLVTGTAVSRVAPAQHQVEVGGRQITYGKLLIATGGSPRELELPEDDRVVYFRSIADFRRLQEIAPKGANVTVVGGGFIGSELASALCQTGVNVTWVMPENQVQEAVFPPSLARKLTKEFTDRGVTLRTGTLVTGGRIDGPSVIVQADSGDEIIADAVVVGAGIDPDDGLAVEAGIANENGILVDKQLRGSFRDDTGRTVVGDIYVAGDVARYDDALLGVRRVEHVDNAEKMGERAGRNMAGESEEYDYTPNFWSDLFDAGYEAVGDIKASLEMVEDWNEAGDAGVVYYLADGKVRGVLLWNVWDSTDLAREVIAKSRDGKLSRDDLAGTIPLG